MNGNAPSWRRVDVDGVGAVDVRPVLLRDTVGIDLSADPAWFHVVLRHGDGRPFTRDDLLDLPVSAANALAQEVMQTRPTQRPSAASSD